MGALAGWLPGHGVREARPSPALDFRRLVGEAGWARLPLAVRHRFAHRAGEEVAYEGRMVVRATWPARWLAQACRLVGTPLAPWTGENVPVRVLVRMEAGGMVWDRLYHFPGRPPVLVTSRKQEGRRGELLEMARGGLGMRSEVTVEDGGLHFRGRGYLWALGPFALPIPAWLTPGQAHVIHQDLGEGRFRFTLRFTHPWLGETIFQDGVFTDPEQG
ncbi:MAG TPA: DUF4166 domain-containing protein [Caulobacter sp.]|nr:DUF4166 domain-containing protein [Caulobacter sp.]